MTPHHDSRPLERHQWLLPLAIALAACAAVIATLDSSGAVPQLGEGPGLTLDETFNVQMGVYHVRSARAYGVGLLHPDSIEEVFGVPAYNPDHPPLGRIVLGIAHELMWGLLEPDVPGDSVCVTCARVGSALAFAATVFLVGWMSARWYGRSVGVVAALSLVLMPRLFAHGHLASLETFVNLGYTATILWVADRWSGRHPPPWRIVVIGGVLFGLCLLTKIQAVLLPIPLGLWTLWRWRMRAVLPMFVFGMSGMVVFFVGWPWLWLNPVEHLSEYFGRTTGRQTLYCWYAGQKWADTAVPWHYPLVMFGVTVPIGLHLLGMIGAVSGKQVAHSSPDIRELFFTRRVLLLLNVAWPLVFFALPGVTVYDGTRLFLMVFPIWAILIGLGAVEVIGWLHERWNAKTAYIVITGLLTCQSFGLIQMHPLGLSYYNLLVGGPRGADRLGFESTYWGDSLTRSFLESVAGSIENQNVVHVAPTLHPFQLSELRAQTPALRKRELLLRPYDDTTGEQIRSVIVFRRRADAWESLISASIAEPDADVRRGGVQLAAFFVLDRDVLEVSAPDLPTPRAAPTGN